MKRSYLAAMAALFLAAGAAAYTAAGAGQSASWGMSSLNRWSASDYDVTRLSLFKWSAARIRSDYVDPDRIHPQQMLDAALQQLSRQVPEVLCSFSPETLEVEVVVGELAHNFRAARVEQVPDLVPVLSEVIGFVDRHLPDDVDRQEMEFALIAGVLSELDPHSVAFTAEQYGEMRVQNEGRFGGLGISIGVRTGRLTVLYPMQGTPAWGVLAAGDKIVRIGAISTVNMDLEEAVSMLRGDPGSEVRITIERDGELSDVSLVREIIRLRTATGAYLGGGMGVVKLTHFSQDTRQTLDVELEALEQAARDEGLSGLEGLVLDLRDNPGGYLQQAKEVADLFIDQGVIVTTVGVANTQRQSEVARSFRTRKDLRVVALVDEGSASASEILAGALRNHDRGVVVGVRTFGKGSVQNLYEHETGAALKLTIGKYLTPDDQDIQALGVMPHIEVRRARLSEERVDLYWQDHALREEDLEDRFDSGEEEVLDQTGHRAISRRLVFLDGESWSGPPMDHEETARDFVEDVQVQLASAILRSSSRPVASTMLEESRDAVAAFAAEQEDLLVSAMSDIGVTWVAAEPGGGEPRAEVAIEVGGESGSVRTGEEAVVTVTVTNVGDAPYERLHGLLSSERFEEQEFLFGRVAPGEERSWTVRLQIPLWFYAPSVEELQVNFREENDRAPGAVSTTVRIDGSTPPSFAFSAQIIDDGSGTSRGNGDGLVQAGEAIDLLLSVRNHGHGDTGVRREREGDEWVEQPAGFARLKNRSGSRLLLTEGTLEFGLAAGEQLQERLHFDVSEDAGTDPLSLELTIGDSSFYRYFVHEFEFPISPPLETAERVRRVRPRAEAATVFAGPDSATTPLATFRGTVEADQRSGEFVRVPIPWGGHGWVGQDEVAASRGEAEAPAFEALMAQSPPTLLLTDNPGGTVVTDDTVMLNGSISDDGTIRDLYAFVNERKVYYQRVDSVGGHAFQVELPLDVGMNEIVVFARDEGELVTHVSLSLVRRDSRANLER